MNRALTLGVCLLAVPSWFACSGDQAVGTGNGSTGGGLASGGSLMVGQLDTGGAFTGGTPSSGGVLVTGGIGASGGVTGTGGDLASGGVALTGGTANGTGGQNGTGGDSNPTDPSVIVPGLDGYLFTADCNGGTASFECPLAGCTNNVLNEQAAFSVAGTAGTVYDITLHVYGVVELRSDYTGGARRQGGASNELSNSDFLYEGGSYTPGMGYNVYGVRVEPAVAGAPDTAGGNNYFLNARDGSGEGHEVYALDFDMTIPAASGSTITFTAYDPNCLAIMNNGETVRPNGSGTGPNGALVIDVVNSAMPPPMNFQQPPSTGGRNGQWVFFDVTGIAPHTL